MYILEQANLCELSIEWTRAGGEELRRSGIAWYWNI